MKSVLPSDKKQRVLLLATIIVFGSAGLYALSSSRATTFNGSIETEDGSITGTSAVSDSTASGSSAVKFKATASTAVRASGLPWSSGVWVHGDLNYANSYVSVARGGVVLDNVMEYTDRSNQANQINSLSYIADEVPSSFNAARDDLVLSVSTWLSDNTYTTGAQGAQIGTGLCSIDSTPIVRLDWEMNLPGAPGHNGAELNSTNYNTWVARFRAVAQGIKSTCPNTRIDFNPNVGADQTSGCSGAVANWCSRRAFQSLKDVVDIYGIDTYDSYPAVTSSGSGWNTRLTGNGWLEETRSYAVANGKKFSVPEWGVACNGGGCQWQGNAGGDDPTYVNDMMDYFKAHAGDMAYETYFSEPNAYIISDLVTNNPSSRAAMANKINQYKGSAGGGGSATSQVPTAGNLVTAKTFTASVGDSTTETGNSLANINDKNESSRWISVPTAGYTITTDLGASYLLSNVKILAAGDTTKTYKVQVSSDGTNFTDASTVMSTDGTTSKQLLTIPTTTGTHTGRYLRIVGGDLWNSTYGNSIWELGAYAN